MDEAIPQADCLSGSRMRISEKRSVFSSWSRHHIRLICSALILSFLFAAVSQAAKEGKMKLSSPAFPDGGSIPVIFTRPAVGGRDISPPLEWSDLPKGTRSLALSVVDPHPVARNWVHWLVIGIPPGITGLPEGASRTAMPTGAKELINSFGYTGYGGPQPPAGTGEHPYVFTIYALDTNALDLPADIDLEGFLAAISPHIIEQAKITGYFGR